MNLSKFWALRADIIWLFSRMKFMPTLSIPESSIPPLARLAVDGDSIITTVAPSKTFNIPGLGLSALIVPDPTHRAALHKVFDQLRVQASNPFSIPLLKPPTVKESLGWKVCWFIFRKHILSATTWTAISRGLSSSSLREPTCYGLIVVRWGKDEDLKRFFVQDAGVGLSPGTDFGKDGSGFMRMDISAPPAGLSACYRARTDKART